MNFSIKGENGFVEITVICRPYANADNYWDLNWLSCGIVARLPAYTAKFSTYLTCGELKSFYDELKKMHESLQGKAALSSLESEIFIDAELKKTGQITWNVETQYPAGYGATLTFDFESDQSFLYEILKDLKSIIEEYPVLEL